jgi:DNA mismatch repair protein MutS2
MNAHALAVLELSRVLGLVADRAASALGAAAVRRLEPTTDRPLIERELSRVEAMRSLIASEPAWESGQIPDIMPALDRLRVDGTVWTGIELRGAAVLLASARRTRDLLRDPRRPAIARAMLAGIADAMPEAREREAEIEHAIGDEGEVRDQASPLLRRLRRELRSAEGDLIALLERIMGGLEAHQQVSDMSVTVRNGRYVIPIRREAKRAVAGIVQDTSATGATLFVEPPAAVEAGNRIRELEAEERREVDRILRALTDALRPIHGGLVAGHTALVDFDTVYARARYADDLGCHPVELGAPADGFVIHDGRHPLLIAQGQTVIPFDLTMNANERTLLVSGPNTGGKTVLLKSVALCSVLAQCGVPAPVGPASRLAIFDDVFADVGDEQSIQASLSTFSAHVKNLGDILAGATPASLVLIDELGSGTDPLEGAALGGAVLEDLTARGALTLATTHLGALKELATEVPGVVNASLQFDAVQLAPTYRLIKGVPGRSYGLSIARRLRLPEAVLARAEARVPQVQRDADALLADLERRDAELADRERVAADTTTDVAYRTERLEARERDLRERDREFERRSRHEARRYLLHARAQVEQTVRELREATAAAAAEGSEHARRARQRVEELVAEQGEALAAIDETDAEVAAPAEPVAPGGVTLRIGDAVEMPAFGGRTGRLLDMRDGDAVVAVGAVKMRVPADSVRPSSRRAPPEPIAVAAEFSEPNAAREIDVRGMRVAEVDDVVMHAVDAAVRSDLAELRIIHGKGTGALRERVAEMLRKDTRVTSVRLGAWNEGGAGVTIVGFA